MIGQTHAYLPALTVKIATALAKRPELFVTHPAELKVLSFMSDDELQAFAAKHGWRVVQRVGGRQIEFYNDASTHYRPL